MSSFRLAAAVFCLAGGLAPASAQTDADWAKKFGRMPDVTSMRIAPDGKHVSYLDMSGSVPILKVADVETGKTTPVLNSGEKLNFRYCQWLNHERLSCTVSGQADIGQQLIGFTRIVAFNLDGSNITELGQRNTSRSLRINQFSGDIIDILTDDPKHVLMEVDLVPERTVGTRLAKTEDGLSVQKVDIYSGRMTMEQRPFQDAQSFVADGRGNIRAILQRDVSALGRMEDSYRYKVNPVGTRDWVTIAETKNSDPGFVSVEGFSEDGSEVYTLRPHEGRQALFRQPADGSGQPVLVFAHDKVDVNGLVTFGRNRRPVGVSWTEDYDHIEFFDPELEALGKGLEAALGGDLDVSLIEDSLDGNRILLVAASDDSPESYYIYDKTTKQLILMSTTRPVLSDTVLAKVTPISYPASDGTRIPGYLTLPAGQQENAKGLPIVVLPHGGPSARDTWGFDWLAQALAADGYAVLQPNYRGSSGFGASWLGENAFRAWQTSIDDINAGARWAISSGLADADKTAILGWSYGGYAALQAATVDPDLYKAVVAIAPVTDLGQLKDDARGFTNFRLVAAQVGNGPHIEAGSPRRRAAMIQAPVLMFHGDKDLNVDVSHARRMENALENANKAVSYTEYENLEHSLRSSKARTDMLTKIGAFLDTNAK